MRVDFERLIGGDSSETEYAANFFETFGYLEITKALTPKESALLRREYIKEIEAKETRRWKDLRKSTNIYFIPNLPCSSEIFYHKLLLDRILPIAKRIGGPKPIYLGGDASCFCGYSFNWHKDWNTRIPQLKFNLYLENDIRIGGHHVIIPGSQHTFDRYTQLLSTCLEWPLATETISGLGANNFLPIFDSPRQNPIRRKLRQLRGRYISPPYVKIKQCPTSLVLFDQRTIHCVQKPFPNRPQLLATALFARDIDDDLWWNSFRSSVPASDSFSQKELYSELLSLFVAERRTIDCTDYGDILKNDPNCPLRYIQTLHPEPNRTALPTEAKLNDWNEYINIQDYMEKLSFRGEKIRQSVKPSKLIYKDLMLGINSLHIKRFDPDIQNN